MRQFIGAKWSVCFALALAACSGDPTLKRFKSGAWEIEGKIDRVSDRPNYAASILTRSRNYNAEPFALQLADMKLMCFDNTPVVYFKFTDKVGSNRNSRLSYRFDRNPGHNVTVRVLRDSKTIVIENQDDVARFIDEMRTASDLIVQVFSLTEFLSTADFKVEGAQKAIDAVYEGCPLPPAQKPRVS